MAARIRYCIIVFLLFPLFGSGQVQWNIKKLSNWDDNSIPNGWTGAFSDCWGYAQADREYAFIGSTQGTYFFDVTDPYNPVQVGYFTTYDTTTLVVNKDYATYSHYLYAVSDQGENALQIFDLQYLPDSVVLAYESDAISRRCHTIFTEGNRLYMCSNTRFDYSVGPMDIYSLDDPVAPSFLGTVWNPGFSFVHEVYVRNNKAFCANGNNGLWIYDVGNPSNPVLLSVLDNYPEQGYNHSAWLTDDGKTMVFTDENRGKGVKIYDITDLGDPELKSIVRSNLLQVDEPTGPFGSMAHNPYIIGNTLLVSWYHDGVVAFDISDPSNPFRIGVYDTHPQDTIYYGSKGCWGLYPYLPSGNIIASDIDNGLFILDGSKILGTHTLPSDPGIFIAPNPVAEQLFIHYSIAGNQDLHCFLYDVTGKMVFNKTLAGQQGNGTWQIPLLGVASGIYVANLEAGEHQQSIKLVVVPK